MMYVDSNYWIYWLDERFPEHEYTVAPVRKAVTKGVLMNYVTLVEVAHYLRMLPEREFLEKMDTIRNLSTLELFVLDDEITRAALKMLPRYSAKGLGGRDCVIIASMKARGVRDLITHDRAFANVEGIHVIDTIPEASTLTDS